MRSDAESLLARLGRRDFRYREFADSFADMELWPIFEALLTDPRVVGRPLSKLEAREAEAVLAIRRLARRPATTIEAETARPVPWVTGAAVMFRTEALKRTGLFDDGFFLYFEETELMARLSAAGWTVWHDPAARFVHLGGRATNIRDASSGLMLPKRLPKYWYEARRRYFVRTHGRAYAVAAGAAFLAGRALWLARCAVQRKADTQPQRTSRDIAAHSLWPIPADTRAAPPSVGGAPGGDPAWMRR